MAVSQNVYVCFKKSWHVGKIEFYLVDYEGKEIMSDDVLTYPFGPWRIQILIRRKFRNGTINNFLNDFLKYKKVSDPAAYSNIKGFRVYICRAKKKCKVLAENFE